MASPCVCEDHDWAVAALPDRLPKGERRDLPELAGPRISTASVTHRTLNASDVFADMRQWCIQISADRP